MYKKTIFVFLLILQVCGHSYGLHATEVVHNAKTVADVLMGDEKLDIIIGDKSALHELVIYSSMTCPHCADFFLKTLQQIKEKYVTTGKLRVVHKHLPTDKQALDACIIAVCGGVDKNYSLTRLFYMKQVEWSLSNNYVSILSQIAKIAGVTQDQINQCFADPLIKNRLMSSRKDAFITLELKGTPTVYLNKKELSNISNIMEVLERTL